MAHPTNPTPLPRSLEEIPGRTVLIVDDEPVIRMIARITLAGAGFVVAEADDIQPAIAAVHAVPRPFDLVFLDLTLPGGQGTAVIPEIRRVSRTTRVLIASGMGEMAAESLGADGFLPKPFNRAALLQAVEHIMHESISRSLNS